MVKPAHAVIRALDQARATAYDARALGLAIAGRHHPDLTLISPPASAPPFEGN